MTLFKVFFVIEERNGHGDTRIDSAHDLDTCRCRWPGTADTIRQHLTERGADPGPLAIYDVQRAN